MRIAAALSTILIITMSQAHAADSNGNYAVWGVGKKSCYGFQKSYEAGETDQFKSYTKGFMTSYNIFSEKTYNITAKMDEKQIMEWLYGHCADNPMSSFENALANYIYEHYDSRMKRSGKGVGR